VIFDSVGGGSSKGRGLRNANRRPLPRQFKVNSAFIPSKEEGPPSRIECCEG
jgi:hypothetical protein